MRTWRLLRDGPGSGPWNMGVDEALLGSAARGVASLRLYTWQGPWLSLGYGQRLLPERRAACRAAGVACVRRVSGGGAVLHGQDLTYAVAAPAAWLPEGLEASYALLSEVLLDALSSLGIEAECPRRGSTGTPRGFDCFAAPTAREICVGGRKLVGSAQRRSAGALLQHGSIRLSPDAPAARAAAGVGRGATSLAELGAAPDRGALEAALCAAFERHLGARLDPGRLRPEEVRSARQRTASGPLGAPNLGHLPASLASSRAPLDGR